MKTKLRIPILLSIIALFVIAVLYYQDKKEVETTSEEEVTTLRKKHADFLKNSPFKETLKLNKNRAKSPRASSKQVLRTNVGINN